jgi:hypothetical protein
MENEKLDMGIINKGLSAGSILVLKRGFALQSQPSGYCLVVVIVIITVLHLGQTKTHREGETKQI